MTSLSTKALLLSKRLIDKYGATIALTTIITSEYNIATGETINTSTSVTVKALIDVFGAAPITSFQDGLVIRRSRQFIVAATGIPRPKPGDEITQDGELWLINSLTDESTGSQSAYYLLQATN